MSKKEKLEEFKRLYSYLEYTLHEIPTGVLYDANGASEEHCKELMTDSNTLEKMAKDLDLEISGFVAYCRWHYERYAHYLSRYKHFNGYAHYIEKYHGPSKI